MSCFSISHVCQSAPSLSPALHPLPTQLHPFIKEPMGTRKLIVRLGISAPCCRADLLTPVPLPSTHHSSSLSLSPLQHSLNECNSYESGSVLLTRLIQPRAVFILEMSQTTSEACCGWMNSNGIPVGPCKWWGHRQYKTNNLYVPSRISAIYL